MKKFLVGVISSLVLSSFAIAAETKDIKINNRVVVIRINNILEPNAPKSLATQEFKKNMESKFPGRVSVVVAAKKEAFTDAEEYEALDIGAVDIIIPTTTKIASNYNVKEFELFDLPFLFTKPEDIIKFTQSNSGDKLLGMFNKKNKNLYAVAYWPNDFRNYIGNKVFKQPEDFKGLNARIESTGSQKTFYDVLGTKETILLPLSSLNEAFKKTGEIKVDVAANPNSNAYQESLFEGAKFLTVSKHDVNSYVFLANRRWFNSLPEDIKIGFVDAAKSAGLTNFELAQKSSNQDLEGLKKKGVDVYTWTKEERDNFKTRAVSVHENYLKNINQEFLNEVYSIVK